MECITLVAHHNKQHIVIMVMKIMFCHSSMNFGHLKMLYICEALAMSVKSSNEFHRVEVSITLIAHITTFPDTTSSNYYAKNVMPQLSKCWDLKNVSHM